MAIYTISEPILFISSLTKWSHSVHFLKHTRQSLNFNMLLWKYCLHIVSIEIRFNIAFKLSPWMQYQVLCSVSAITKTRLYNFDLFKRHFYIVKLGFRRVYNIFLFC